MPIGEVVGGAFLGVVLELLLSAIKTAKDRSLTTKYIFNRLETTIANITPLVFEIDKIIQEMEDPSKKIIEDLRLQLENAVSLVEAYAGLRRRNLLEKFSYKRRIRELDTSLRRFICVDVQVKIWADITELKTKNAQIYTKLDKITHIPTDCMCDNHSMSQSTNHDILEEENGDCSIGGSKPKIDINICWNSRKQNKNRKSQFIFKRCDKDVRVRFLRLETSMPRTEELEEKK